MKEVIQTKDSCSRANKRKGWKNEDTLLNPALLSWTVLGWAWIEFDVPWATLIKRSYHECRGKTWTEWKILLDLRETSVSKRVTRPAVVKQETLYIILRMVSTDGAQTRDQPIRSHNLYPRDMHPALAWKSGVAESMVVHGGQSDTRVYQRCLIL